MSKTIVACARSFDGLSDTISGPTEILIENDVIAHGTGSRLADHQFA